MRLTFTGKAEKPVPVSFQGILQMPVFTTNAGNHEMEINIPEMQESLALEIRFYLSNNLGAGYSPLSARLNCYRFFAPFLC